jgi:hypothetical protein
MNNNGIPGYLQEIPDTGWVHEAIGELFDGILEQMTPNSVVYGGAVRDCLAGLELLGDLDIAVSRQEFSELSKRIQTSPKWLPKDVSNYNPHEHEEGPGGAKKPWHHLVSSPSRPKLGGSGGMARELAPMSGVCEFVGANGREVQLITSKQHTKDPFQDAVYMARMVDIVCCAMIMTADGRIFEAVPGAYQDCRDRVLRVNDSSATLFIEALPNRVLKLVERGWDNKIDVEKAMKELERQRAADKRKQERRLMASRRKRAKSAVPAGSPTKDIRIFNIKGDRGTEDLGPIRGGETWEYSAETVHKTFGGDVDRLVRAAKEAALHAGVNITGKISPLGSVYFTAVDYHRLREFRDHFDHITRNITKPKKATVTGRLKGRVPTMAKMAEHEAPSRSEKKLADLGIMYRRNGQPREAKQAGLMELKAASENLELKERLMEYPSGPPARKGKSYRIRMPIRKWESS